MAMINTQIVLKKTDSMKVPYIYTEREENMVFDKGSIYLSLDENQGSILKGKISSPHHRVPPTSSVPCR